MHGVKKVKKTVTVSVERMSYDPVKTCLNLLGRNFSDFVNGFVSILARDLRGCNVDDPHECVAVIDKFFDRARGVKL